MPRRLPDILPIDWPQEAAAPPAATDAALDRAVTLIRSGGLVAIPTETVYGLATDALDSESVDRIFRAKGRPATNPLIVHVADQAMARSLASAWPAAAEAIATHFWPGPVTVVVPKHRDVPDIVTAGGPTVALRCPAHRLTRRLIERSGYPLAAPSANRSEALSPTRAAHVLESLGDRVDLILDGGPCTHGIESTVVDCTVSPPRILRPGPIGREALEAAIGGRPPRPGPTGRGPLGAAIGGTVDIDPAKAPRPPHPPLRPHNATGTARRCSSPRGKPAPRRQTDRLAHAAAERSECPQSRGLARPRGRADARRSGRLRRRGLRHAPRARPPRPRPHHLRPASPDRSLARPSRPTVAGRRDLDSEQGCLRSREPYVRERLKPVVNAHGGQVSRPVVTAWKAGPHTRPPGGQRTDGSARGCPCQGAGVGSRAQAGCPKRTSGEWHG